MREERPQRRDHACDDFRRVAAVGPQHRVADGLRFEIARPAQQEPRTRIAAHQFQSEGRARCRIVGDDAIDDPGRAVVFDVDVKDVGAMVQAGTVAAVNEAGALQFGSTETQSGGAVVESLRGRGARRKRGQRQRNERCTRFADQNCLRKPTTTP